MFLCARCGFDFYQNPVPAAVVVIVAPDDPQGVLLLKRSTPPGIGRWCLPGGFIRYDETPEAAAAREAREEIGASATIERVVHVGLLHYAYKERRICVLEIAYLARLRDAQRLSLTAESSALEFRSCADVLDAPRDLAFPEHVNVLRAFLALRRG
jgi:ADP-ribose pyrophosphatase YjhB (NUDIX family)